MSSPEENNILSPLLRSRPPDVTLTRVIALAAVWWCNNAALQTSRLASTQACSCSLLSAIARPYVSCCAATVSVPLQGNVRNVTFWGGQQRYIFLATPAETLGEPNSEYIYQHCPL
ncbi:hypothetical protein MRX96_054643 [Rhipicephalus microplus]